MLSTGTPHRRKVNLRADKSKASCGEFWAQESVQPSKGSLGQIQFVSTLKNLFIMIIIGFSVNLTTLGLNPEPCKCARWVFYHWVRPQPNFIFFIIYKVFIIILSCHVCVFLWICTCQHRCLQRLEKSRSSPGTGETGGVSPLMWVPGTNFRTSVKTVHTVNLWAIP